MKTAFLSCATAALLLGSAPLRADPVENIVLVHGAFVDASIWNGVSERLLDAGFTVRAVQLPLTSLEADVAATQAVLDRLEGPTLLVGYSWGGVPATVAGTDPDVRGLVYFAAVTPSPGESLGEMLRPYSSAAIFAGKPDRAGWQEKPSWYVVATEDHIFPVPRQRALAGKIGATVTEWPTGHAAILSRPGASAALIARAAEALVTPISE